MRSNNEIKQFVFSGFLQVDYPFSRLHTMIGRLVWVAWRDRPGQAMATSGMHGAWEQLSTRANGAGNN